VKKIVEKKLYCPVSNIKKKIKPFQSLETYTDKNVSIIILLMERGQFDTFYTGCTALRQGGRTIYYRAIS